MVTLTDCTDQKRKGCGGAVFAHLSRHHRAQATDRGGCTEGIEQVCPSRTIGDEVAFGARLTVLLALAGDQNGRHEAICVGSCKYTRTHTTFSFFLSKQPPPKQKKSF